jgi:hypothetical protein
MKVLILGLAKSGTTALAYKIHKALGPDAELNFEPGKTTGAEDLSLHEKITGSSQSLVTKNLIFPTTETRWDDIFANSERYDRAIWIVRDPRDIIISNFFYHWFQGHKTTEEKFRTALQRTRRKEADPGGTPFIDLVAGTMTENREQLGAWQRSWYGILADAAPGIRRHMHVLRYEDFVDAHFDALNSYLGLDLWGATEVPDEHQRVVRTRAYDNWRRWFTDEDVAFFKPILSQFLHTMGYDKDDWGLTQVENLPAEEGSRYMEKLYNSRPRARPGSMLRRVLSKIGVLR